MRLSFPKLPSAPGTYVLVLWMPRRVKLPVGKLGTIAFKRGWYTYVGSAFGPGGLAGRLGHHLKPIQNPHWHIDYLHGPASVVEVWYSKGSPSREHKWASLLMHIPFSGRPVRGFGCSDCRCRSHLVYFQIYPGRSFFRQTLGVERIGRI